MTKIPQKIKKNSTATSAQRYCIRGPLKEKTYSESGRKNEYYYISLVEWECGRGMTNEEFYLVDSCTTT
jgi:hypothetical protein